MSPLLIFIFVFFTVQFIIYHVRAGKRIRALEANLLDLQKAINQHLDNTLDFTKVMDKVIEVSGDHDKELMSIRAKLKMNEREKS